MTTYCLRHHVSDAEVCYAVAEAVRILVSLPLWVMSMVFMQMFTQNSSKMSGPSQTYCLQVNDT